VAPLGYICNHASVDTPLKYRCAPSSVGVYKELILGRRTSGLCYVVKYRCFVCHSVTGCLDCDNAFVCRIGWRRGRGKDENIEKLCVPISSDGISF